MKGQIRAWWLNALIITITVSLWLSLIGGVLVGVGVAIETEAMMDKLEQTAGLGEQGSTDENSYAGDSDPAPTDENGYPLYDSSGSVSTDRGDCEYDHDTDFWECP